MNRYGYIRSRGDVGDENKIPDDARYEDIEEYIRNKYKNYLNSNP